MVTKEMVLDCMEKNPELIQIGAYQDGKAVPVSKDTPIEDLACTIGGKPSALVNGRTSVLFLTT